MLRAKLTLESKIFKRDENRAILAKAVEDAARKLHQKIIDKVLKSPRRTGKVYRIKMPSGEYKNHQASARGEPPAVLTSNLINSIKLVKLGRYTWRIKIEAPYAAYLDSDEFLGRPFFASEIKAFQQEYDAIMAKAYTILTDI